MLRNRCFHGARLNEPRTCVVFVKATNWRRNDRRWIEYFWNPSILFIKRDDSPNPSTCKLITDGQEIRFSDGCFPSQLLKCSFEQLSTVFILPQSDLILKNQLKCFWNWTKAFGPIILSLYKIFWPSKELKTLIWAKTISKNNKSEKIKPIYIFLSNLVFSFFIIIYSLFAIHFNVQILLISIIKYR